MRSRLQEASARAVGSCSPRRAPRTPAPAFSLEVPRSAEHGDFACNVALLLAKPLRRPPREIAERLIAKLGVGEAWSRAPRWPAPASSTSGCATTRWRGLLRGVLEQGRALRRARSCGAASASRSSSSRPIRPGRSRWGTDARPCSATRIARAARGVGLPRHARVLLQQRRAPDARARRVRARALPRAARPRGAAAEMRRRRGAAWPESDRRAAGRRFRATATRATTSARSPPTWSRKHGDGAGRRARRGRLPRGRRAARLQRDPQDARRARHQLRRVLERDGALRGWASSRRRSPTLRKRDLVYDERRRGLAARDRARPRARPRADQDARGEPTYLLPDIAYHREKFRRGFDRIIDVQGADHIEQFPFVRAAVGALGCPSSGSSW